EQAGIDSKAGAVEATLFLGVTRGLLLDLCATEGRARVGRAMNMFAELREDRAAPAKRQAPELCRVRTGTGRQGLVRQAGAYMRYLLPSASTWNLDAAPGANYSLIAAPSVKDQTVRYDVVVLAIARRTCELLPCGQQGGNSWSSL